MSTKPTPEALAKMGLKYDDNGMIVKIGIVTHPDVQKAEERAVNKPKPLADIQGYNDADFYIDHVIPMQEELAIEQINDYVRHIDEVEGNDWAERNQKAVEELTKPSSNAIWPKGVIDDKFKIPKVEWEKAGESNPGALIKIPTESSNFETTKPKQPEQDKYVGGIDPYTPVGLEVESGPDAGMFKAALYFGRPNDEEAFIKEVEKTAQYYGNNLTKERIYIGIDPGKSGGIVALSVFNKLIDKWPMPVLGDNLDVSAMFDLLKKLMDDYAITVIMEDVHSIFGVSASNNFTFGYVCGAIEAVVLCLKLKMIKVAPKTWQKEIWANGDKVFKTKKPDQKNPSIDTKATSLCAVTRLFPTVDLRKSSRAKIAADGIVDALLLAEYGRRKNI